MKLKIPSSMAKKFSRQILVAKKNSPHIFFAVGILGTVASTVLACRATLKLSKALDEIQGDVDTVKSMRETDLQHAKEVTPEGTDLVYYTNARIVKDSIHTYARAGVKLTKLYGPSIVVGVASIGCLTGSHIQLHRRNIGLMAAYAAMQTAFEDYRDRVRKELGVEKEQELYHPAKSEYVRTEDGKKELVKSGDPNRYSPYAKFFDEQSMHWHKDPEYNRIYVMVQQTHANNLLHARGHIFLNEVYDMLDVGRTEAGAVVGWVLNSEGDNYVNFGLYEAYNAAFVNGHERSMLLDFNVDGVIYDKLGGDSDS